MENVLHGKNLIDEEMDLEEHKPRLAFVVIILGDGNFGGKSDQFKGRAVSRDRSVQKPRHQKGPGEAGMKNGAAFPLEYRLTCEKENFTA